MAEPAADLFDRRTCFAGYLHDYTCLAEHEKPIELYMMIRGVDGGN
jgi:hypothetical protein